MTHPNIATEAQAVEQMLRVGGLDPDHDSTYPVWTQWERKGLSGALAAFVGAPKDKESLVKNPLQELRARRDATADALRALDLELQQLEDEKRDNRRFLRLADRFSPLEDIAAAERALATVGRAIETCIEARNAAAREATDAELRYHQAAQAVVTARRNLARLAELESNPDLGIALAPGDIRRHRDANRAVLRRYGMAESVDSLEDVVL